MSHLAAHLMPSDKNTTTALPLVQQRLNPPLLPQLNPQRRLLQQYQPRRTRMTFISGPARVKLKPLSTPPVQFPKVRCAKALTISFLILGGLSKVALLARVVKPLLAPVKLEVVWDSPGRSLGWDVLLNWLTLVMRPFVRVN